MKDVKYIFLVAYIILISIFGMAIGVQYGAPFGWLAFVSMPLAIRLIREIKS